MQNVSASFIKKHSRVIILALLTLAFISILLVMSATGGYLSFTDTLLTDLFFRLRYAIRGTEKISPGPVNIFFDDNDLESLQAEYGSREMILAELIDILNEADVHSIVFDFVFRKKGNTGYGIFTEKVKAAGNVFLPVILVNDKSGNIPNGQKAVGTENFLWHPVIRNRKESAGFNALWEQDTELLQTVKGSGFVNITGNRDGIIRSCPLLLKGSDGYVPHLMFAVYCAFRDIPAGDMEYLDSSRIILKDPQNNNVVPLNREGQLIINHAGPWQNTFPGYSLKDILTNRKRLFTYLSGRIVLLSDNSTAGRDLSPGIFDTTLPNSYAMLNLLNTMLTGNFLQEWGIPVKITICLIFIFILLFLFTRTPVAWYPAGLFLIFAVYTILNFAGFLFAGRLPYLSVPVASMLCALILVLMFRLFLYKLHLKEQDREINELNKLTATGLLASALIHDLSGPNSTIFLESEYLTAALEEFFTGLSGSEKSRDQAPGGSTLAPGLPAADLLASIEGIRQGSAKITAQLNQLRSFYGKTDISGMEAVDLGKVLLHTENCLPVKIRRLLQICRISEAGNSLTELPPVRGNRVMLEQMFLNLILNAYQAIETGQLIRIAGSFIKVTTRHNVQKAGIEITVSDNGPGIETEKIPEIFRLHYTTKRDSTGMGLFLTRKIIEKHGGTMNFISSPAAGTTVSIFLPLQGNGKSI